jgi:uncharacterized protein YybS (DUF2232 family)
VPKASPGEIPKDILTGIAITIFIFAVAIYLPIIGFFCALFIPLPVLFYRSKLGRKTGGIVPAATIIIMLIIADGVSVDIMFFIALLFLGFILSELIEMNLSIDNTILFAAGSVVVIGLAGLLFYSTISNTGVKALVSDYVSNNLALTLALYENMGMSEENLHMISNSLEKIRYALVRILPALVIAATLFVSWSNLLLAKLLLTGRNLFYPDFGMLSLWRPPESLVWGVIGSGAMLLLPSGGLKMLGLNGLIVLVTIYFFGGMAIVSFYFENKKFPRTLRIFVYSLIALQQIVLLIVIGIGFFDTWFNFRKIGLNKN